MIGELESERMGGGVVVEEGFNEEGKSYFLLRFE